MHKRFHLVASSTGRPPFVRKSTFRLLYFPLTPVTQAAPLRSECLLDPDARHRGVDANVKSAGNTQRLQLPTATPHHQEVVSRGGHQAFERPSDGYANAETSVARPYPADTCRPPSAPCGVGSGPHTGPPYQPGSLLMDTPLP